MSTAPPRRPATPNAQSRYRHNRSAIWFSRHWSCTSVILHHRHIRRVLVSDWSLKMDGINATIWASQTTTDHYRSAMPGVGEPGTAPRTTDHTEPQANEIAEAHRFGLVCLLGQSRCQVPVVCHLQRLDNGPNRLLLADETLSALGDGLRHQAPADRA